MKNNKGFTILELIIVIVITAILATFAVPSIRSWRANSSLSGDTRTLKADFEFARSRAIRDNTPITISFNTGNNSYSIDSVPPVSRSLVGTSISTNLTGAATTITFDSRGRAANNITGSVTLSNGSRNTTVSVSMIGSIQIN